MFLLINEIKDNDRDESINWILADKFKKYNWFLPSSGEVARILYYIYQSYKDGVAQETPVNSKYGLSYKDAAANAFYNVINLGIFKANKFGATQGVWSSTETDQSTVVSVNSSGTCSNTSKMTTRRVIPICRF